MAKKTDDQTEDQNDAAPSNAGAVAARHTRMQDEAITRGVRPAGMTEDEKRAMGLDASQEAGPHDFSPEANRDRGASAGILDTYAHGEVEHPFISGAQAKLVLGQAPTVPASPMPGSDASFEQMDMEKPNAINRSPVMRGIDIDERNDPTHPLHGEADKNHPDYGRPRNQQRGVRTEAPTYDQVKNKPSGEDATAA